MPVSLIPSFLLYAYMMAITPGPANLCSLAASLRYGKKAALRQWRGLFVGFFLVSMASVIVTWFLGAALNEYVGILSWVGAAYILWMAWHTLRSAGGQRAHDPAAPCFRTGILIQLTNVKVMVSCLTILTGYVLPHNRSFWALLAVGLFLPFTGPIANLVWLFAGAALQKVFANHRRTIDIIMAIALALCAVSLIWPR